jgi:ABC-2 type transport system permease protein
MNTLIRLELAAFFRRPVVRWMILFWPLLLIAAAWSTERYHLEIDKVVESLVAEETAYYDGLLETAHKIDAGVIPSDSLPWHRMPSNPLVAGLFRASGHYCVNPSSDMRWLAIGFADVRPPAYHVKTGRILTPSAVTLENPFHQALGRFDTAFVLVFLLPLFCIMIAYDMRSKDMESGLMDYARSHGLKGGVLVTFRAVIHLLFWTALTTATLMFIAGWLSSNQTSATLFITVPLVAYLLFFIGIAALVNLAGGSSIQNGLSLISVWLLVILIIPSLANAWLNAAFPPPSRWDEVAAKRSAEVSSEWQIDPVSGQAEWHEYWTNEFLRRRLVDSLHTAEVSAMNRVLNRRHEWSTLLEQMTPSLWFQSILMEAAGVSARNYLDFQGAVETFERKWTTHFMNAFQNQRPLTRDELLNRPQFRMP